MIYLRQSARMRKGNSDSLTRHWIEFTSQLARTHVVGQHTYRHQRFIRINGYTKYPRSSAWNSS
jgi:hypothetical protein